MSIEEHLTEAKVVALSSQQGQVMPYLDIQNVEAGTLIRIRNHNVCLLFEITGPEDDLYMYCRIYCISSRYGTPGYRGHRLVHKWFDLYRAVFWVVDGKENYLPGIAEITLLAV